MSYFVIQLSKKRLRHEKVYEVYEKVPEMILHHTRNYDMLYYNEDNSITDIKCDLDILADEDKYVSIQIYKNSPKTLEVTKK